jgi:hypothetical protein
MFANTCSVREVRTTQRPVIYNGGSDHLHLHSIVQPINVKTDKMQIYFLTFNKMTRFVRIGQTVIHVPSLANVSMSTDCYGRPYLTFYYHNQHNQTITYGWGKWAECEKDMLRVKGSMMEIEKALSTVPLTESAESVPEAQNLSTM